MKGLILMKTFKVNMCQRPCFHSKKILDQEVCCKKREDDCMEALRLKAIRRAKDENNSH